MRKVSTRIYDRVAGYLFLCWICRRPVLASPPRLTDLFDAFITSGDELKTYLADLGVEFPSWLDEVTPPSTNPKKFSEIAKNDRRRSPSSDDAEP